MLDLLPSELPLVFLESLVRDFDPCGRDSVTQLLQICWLPIYDVNLRFSHIPKVLQWNEIWSLWRSLEDI